MTTTTFDALGYFEKLKGAGVPEEQAKVQAAAFREFSSIQEENARRELATKLDLAQLKKELTKEIHAAKHETIRWFVGLMIGLAAFLASILAYVK